MRYRLFGRTGLRISELLLGAMGFRDAQQSRRIVDAYADAGGNVIDTASAYGESEAILGEAIAQRDRFVLATKYTLSRDPADPNASGNHRKNLRLSLDRSLSRLRTDYIDIYWVHIWDRHTPIEETMRALDDAVRSGKVLYLGISDAPAWVVSRANTLAELRDWTRFDGLQVPYSLIKRDIERELLPMAEGLGMSVATWAPLGSGALAGSTARNALTPQDRAVVTAVQAAADELGVTPAQVALSWLRSKSRAVHPLMGVSSVQQLTDNIGALTLTLPDEVTKRLESVVDFAPGFPADFVAECEPHPFVFGDTAMKIDGRGYNWAP
jgi:aryl-alcohol dehydrogenase-like predicted oxidoreductase